jgi:hypothetical protein
MLPEPHTEVITEAPAEPEVAAPEPAVEEVPTEQAVDPNSVGMEQEEPTESANEEVALDTAPSDLSALKLEALHELSPLVGQLDQTPSEQYETAKMIYEGTNDQATLGAVYEAAKNLPDDRAKATAIYDVIKKIDAL